MAAAPQYTLRLKDWKTAVDPPADAFTFKPPAQDALYEPNTYRSSDHDGTSCRAIMRTATVAQTPMAL